MDIIRLYQDYAIKIADETEKHHREGWINTNCPFCTGNPGSHLGYNTDKEYFYCWRCGSHPTTKTISSILNIPFNQAKQIEKQYRGKTYKKRWTTKKFKRYGFKMPPFTTPLTAHGLGNKYMKSRNFSDRDMKILEKKFGLICSRPGCLFGDMDLSYRLIAPIYFKNKIISWQSRDMTNRSELKYLTCPQKYEKKDHKTVLYNYDPKKEKTILVEGIFDVWRVYLAGYHAVSCFGVSYTYDQLEMLIKYKNVVIFLDPDKAGIKQGRELRKQLLFAGVKAKRIKAQSNKDPADMTVNQIKKILRGE